MKLKYNSSFTLVVKLVISASVIGYVLAGFDRGEISQAVEEVKFPSCSFLFF